MSNENPLNDTDEEFKHPPIQANQKSKFGSSKQMGMRFGSDLGIQVEDELDKAKNEFDNHPLVEKHHLPERNSYANSGVKSPLSGSESVSVPFNFTSDSGGYDRTSAQNIQSRIRNAGAAVMADRSSGGFERTTTVRIRGKQTEITEGMIGKSLEEQKKYQSKKKEIRRANERLRTLEKLEKHRQQKVKEEIEALEEERRLQEDNKESKCKADMERRKKIAKQRRDIQAAKSYRAQSKQRELSEKREKEEASKEKVNSCSYHSKVIYDILIITNLHVEGAVFQNSKRKNRDLQREAETARE